MGIYTLVQVIGFSLLYIMYKLDDVWFDRIGEGILTLSIIAFALMLFFPGIVDNRIFLKIGSFSMQPTLHFLLGVVWFFDFSHRSFRGYRKCLIGLVSMMIFLVWLLMVKVDPPMMILIGLSVLCIIGYRYGISKTFFMFLGGFISIYGLVMLNAPYRMQRIQSWWEMIVSGKSFAMPSGIDLIASKMHAGLFIYNEWGSIALAVIVVMFIWLIINIWKVEGLFSKGIAIVFTLDILFHIVNFFELTIVKPPALFIVEYGVSITMMKLNHKKDEEQ